MLACREAGAGPPLLRCTPGTAGCWMHLASRRALGRLPAPPRQAARLAVKAADAHGIGLLCYVKRVSSAGQALGACGAVSGVAAHDACSG